MRESFLSKRCVASAHEQRFQFVVFSFSSLVGHVFTWCAGVGVQRTWYMVGSKTESHVATCFAAVSSRSSAVPKPSRSPVDADGISFQAHVQARRFRPQQSKAMKTMQHKYGGEKLQWGLMVTNIANLGPNADRRTRARSKPATPGGC